MFLVGVPEMGLAKLGQKEESIRFLQLFKTHVIPKTATDPLEPTVDVDTCDALPL